MRRGRPVRGVLQGRTPRIGAGKAAGGAVLPGGCRCRGLPLPGRRRQVDPLRPALRRESAVGGQAHPQRSAHTRACRAGRVCRSLRTGERQGARRARVRRRQARPGHVLTACKVLVVQCVSSPRKTFDGCFESAPRCASAQPWLDGGSVACCPPSWPPLAARSHWRPRGRRASARLSRTIRSQ